MARVSKTRKKDEEQKQKLIITAVVVSLITAVVVAVISYAFISKQYEEQGLTLKQSPDIELSYREQLTSKESFSGVTKNKRAKKSTQKKISKRQEKYIQTGTFAVQKNAESLRASILLMGLPVDIKLLAHSSGKQLHQVVVGPLSAKQFPSAIATLKKNKIEYLY